LRCNLLVKVYGMRHFRIYPAYYYQVCALPIGSPSLGKVPKKRRFIMNSNTGELNSRQKIFCEEYLKDSNARKAAIRAGYSERSAASIGYENLQKPKIKRYISQLMQARNLRTQVTADRVLEELAKVGFAKQGEKTGHKLKALGMLARHVGIFDNQPKLEKQALTSDVSKIDLNAHKSQSIKFYKQLINSPNISKKIRLTAQKQLDHLLGLDQISTETPEEFAAKIRESLAEMDASVGGPEEAFRRKNSANLTIC